MPKINNRFHTLLHCISSTSQKQKAQGHAKEPLTLPLNSIEPAILLHPELFENKSGLIYQKLYHIFAVFVLTSTGIKATSPCRNLACVSMWLGIGKKTVWRLLLVHVHQDKACFHHQKGNGLILGGWIIYATSHNFLQLLMEKSMGTILGAKKSFLWLPGAGVSQTLLKPYFCA